MESKEHKIGECFIDGNTLLQTVEFTHCINCFYRHENNCWIHRGIAGPCSSLDRTDGKDVIFKEINEENSNKDERFYIWGVPNRGEEVAKLLESKGLDIVNYDDSEFCDGEIIIYGEEGQCRFIDKGFGKKIINLITSNWTEIKLPYKFKDKEFVWAWDNDSCIRILGFYNLKNNCLFSFEGKRVGCSYDHYKSYEGEYPQWAKESLAKLEE